MIEIDGSYGEGGGQILRTSLALSIHTKKPFRMINIRKGRCNPGLSEQHLKCVEAAAEFSGGSSEGAEIGSEEIQFIPGEDLKNNIHITIGTAGSVTLLTQALLLPAIFSGKKHKFVLEGGTDVKWSIPVDYFLNVMVPMLNRFGTINAILIKRGYYPKGGGKIEIIVLPNQKEANNDNNIQETKNREVDLTGSLELSMIKGISHASLDLQEKKVAERQAGAASYFLRKHGFENSIAVNYTESRSTGSGIVLWAILSKKNEMGFTAPTMKGGDSLGDKKLKAEEVGEKAAKKLLEQLNNNSPVDEFLADNIIPFIGILGGKVSVPKITGHVKSNIYVTEKFLGKEFVKKGLLIQSGN